MPTGNVLKRGENLFRAVICTSHYKTVVTFLSFTHKDSISLRQDLRLDTLHVCYQRSIFLRKFKPRLMYHLLFNPLSHCTIIVTLNLKQGGGSIFNIMEIVAKLEAFFSIFRQTVGGSFWPKIICTAREIILQNFSSLGLAVLKS